MIKIDKKGLKSFQKYLKDNNLNEEDYICKHNSKLFTDKLVKSLAILRNKQIKNKIIEPAFLNYNLFDNYEEKPIYHYKKSEILAYIENMNNIENIKNRYENKITKLKEKEKITYKVKRKFNQLKKKIENQSFSKIFGISLSIFLFTIIIDMNLNKNEIQKINHKHINLNKIIEDK